MFLVVKFSVYLNRRGFVTTNHYPESVDKVLGRARRGGSVCGFLVFWLQIAI